MSSFWEEVENEREREKESEWLCELLCWSQIKTQKRSKDETMQNVLSSFYPRFAFFFTRSSSYVPFPLTLCSWQKRRKNRTHLTFRTFRFTSTLRLSTFGKSLSSHRFFTVSKIVSCLHATLSFLPSFSISIYSHSLSLASPFSLSFLSLLQLIFNGLKVGKATRRNVKLVVRLY